MNADRPLTDAQERFLIALADADHDDYAELHGRVPLGLNVPHRMHHLRETLRGATRNDPRVRAALREAGLIETNTSHFAQITEAGVAMLRSMGD